MDDIEKEFQEMIITVMKQRYDLSEFEIHTGLENIKDDPSYASALNRYVMARNGSHAMH